MITLAGLHCLNSLALYRRGAIQSDVLWVLPLLGVQLNPHQFELLLRLSCEPWASAT